MIQQRIELSMAYAEVDEPTRPRRGVASATVEGGWIDHDDVPCATARLHLRRIFFKIVAAPCATRVRLEAGVEPMAARNEPGGAVLGRDIVQTHEEPKITRYLRPTMYPGVIPIPSRGRRIYLWGRGQAR